MVCRADSISFTRVRLQRPPAAVLDATFTTTIVRRCRSGWPLRTVTRTATRTVTAPDPARSDERRIQQNFRRFGVEGELPPTWNRRAPGAVFSAPAPWSAPSRRRRARTPRAMAPRSTSADRALFVDVRERLRARAWLVRARRSCACTRAHLELNAGCAREVAMLPRAHEPRAAARRCRGGSLGNHARPRRAARS